MDPGSPEAANLVTTGCIVPREHRSEDNDDDGYGYSQEGPARRHP
jgi:hypothetical protein